MMDFAAVLEFLLKSFANQKIDYAFIGGFALQAAGVTRSTQDIDFLVLARDGDKIKNLMTAKGYRILHESPDVMNFLGNQPQLGRVDFLLAHRKYTLGTLARAKTKDLFGGQLKAKFAEPEDLIGLKVQSSSNDATRMDQDMADIKSLLRTHYPRLDTERIREYFQLFDREKELDQLILEVKNASDAG